MRQKKEKGNLIVRRCVQIVLLFAVSFTVAACGRQDAGDSATEPDTEEVCSAVTGVVTVNDTDAQTLQIQELDSNVISTLHYTAQSVVEDEYGKQQYGDDVEIGMILTAQYRPSDAFLVSAAVPDEVWSYKDVSKFSFQSEESSLTVAGQKYQYSDATCFMADGTYVVPEEYNSQDILTVRGIGISVYSVVKTAGHGYIRLVNYSDFIGGMAQVSASLIVPIADNMLITAAEGTYDLTLCKSGVAVVKTVTVVSNEEVTVDFSDYEIASANVGVVTFYIEPDGAALYINGTAVDYTKPVSFQYGKYNVSVTLNGYESYAGVLSVAEPTSPVYIDLAEKTASTGDDEEEDEETQEDSSEDSQEQEDSDDETTVTKSMDSSHTITVSAPEGVEVYLDNVYKGLAPCTFTKIIGSQTITLSDTGYVTKSYSVDILDDDKDVTLSFADLEREEDTD